MQNLEIEETPTHKRDDYYGRKHNSNGDRIHQNGVKIEQR